MAENTSVGNIQLDIEINQKSVDKEISKVSNFIGNGFKNMFNGMASQTGNFMKNSLEKMNNGFKGFTQSGTQSSDRVSQSVNKMNGQYQKTEEQIKSIQKELAKLFAEQDEIARGFQNFPPMSGMTKDETMGHMLKSNPKYNELSEQIEKLTAKMNPLINKNKTLAEEINNVGNSAEGTGSKINSMGRNTKKVGKEVDKATWKTRLFGDEMKKSGVKSAGFAAMINRSFSTILRRLFVYNLIMKGIRGIMNYTGAALKTNRDFVSSLNQVKTNLMVAFQPIYEFIIPALNALMRAVAIVTTYIASAISALFGKTYQQSYNAAKNLDSTKKAMAGYGKAAKKAGKDAKSALAGFDEINTLDIKDNTDSDSDGGGSGDFAMTMPDTSTIDLSGLERFKEIISSLFEPFKLAWEKEGQSTIDAMKNAFSSILDLTKSIGKSWLEVWTNGTGQKTVENILKIIQNIFNIVGNLATALKDAWNENEVGTRIIQIMFDIFNIILETIKKITGSTAEWVKTLDFTPLLESISKLLEALKPLTQNIGDGLVWLWENALLPLAGWVIEDVIPVFLNILAESIKILNNVIEALKPLGLWLLDNFLEPIAVWTGGVIVSVLEGIRDALKSVGDWIKGHQSVVENMAIVIGSFMTAWTIVDLAVKVGGIVSALATFITTGGLATAVMSGFAGVMAFITSPITIAVAVIGALIAAGVLLYKNWEEVSKKAKEIWNGIATFFSDTWSKIKGFFSKNQEEIRKHDEETWNKIKSKITETWNNIKSFLIDKIWNPIKDTAKTIWEGIKKNILDPIEQSWTKLKELWDKIKKYILDKWDEIRQGISNMKNNLVNAIKEPFDIAQNFIDGVIKNAFNWGKNLIGEFISGIKSMAGKVTDSISGVVGGIKDFIGFSSPTKKGPGSTADKWMPNLMGMLADGIQDNIYEVSAAVSMTAGSIQQGIQPSTNDMAASIGSAVSQSMQGLSNSGGDITAIVKIGEDTLTDKVVSNINRQSRISGKTIITV